MTLCGLNEGPLIGKGEYPTYIACNLFADKTSAYVGEWNAPKIMQDGKDGDAEIGYIGNITNSTTAGFKYFKCEGIKEIKIQTRGYGDGVFEVRTQWEGKVLAELKLHYTNVWEEYVAPISIPDGVHALYFTYKGDGNVGFRSFELN